MKTELSRYLSEVFRSDPKQPENQNAVSKFAPTLRIKEVKKINPFIVDEKFRLGLDEII